MGQAMTDHPDIGKVGFTGSTGVGKTIMKSAAESNVKKVSLELGGKSPLIIFGDCEMDKAVRIVSRHHLSWGFIWGMCGGWRDWLLYDRSSVA